MDFVIIWVDGNDPAWQKEFKKYSELKGDKRELRYRDLDILKYWFRGVEKFSPWVDKIHFVTWGHLPEWLNTSHHKLNIVRHEDYIPEEYLPTFSANPIEMNIHRIKGLSEQFVFFNDDMFLLQPVKETVFFKNSLPCDIAALNALQPSGDFFDSIICNDLAVINRHFTKKDLKKHIGKWISPKYGKRLLQSLPLMPYPGFTGFVNPHLPQAFLKSSFEKVWEMEPDVLHRTCKNKFRHHTDVNQWLIRYYQLATGCFMPRNPYKYYYTVIGVNDNNIDEAVSMIKNQKSDMVCINDSECRDIEMIKRRLADAFECILTEKSTFEK